MDFRTDRQRVQGLGTAGHAAGHWWSQRITSAALAPLGACFVFPFARALGGPWERVIEDYVHDKPVRVAMIFANALLSGAFAFTGIFAVAKIAFG